MMQILTLLQKFTTEQEKINENINTKLKEQNPNKELFKAYTQHDGLIESMSKM